MEGRGKVEKVVFVRVQFLSVSLFQMPCFRITITSDVRGLSMEYLSRSSHRSSSSCSLAKLIA